MDPYDGVKNYVAQRRGQGMSDQQIAAELRNGGWQEGAIQQALSGGASSSFQSSNPYASMGSTQTSGSSLKNNKTMQFILLIVGAIALFGILIFLFTLDPGSSSSNTVENGTILENENFAIVLPEDWQIPESYTAETTLVLLENNAGDADLGINVQVAGSESIDDAIKATRNSLENASQLSIEGEERIEHSFGGFDGQIVEFIAVKTDSTRTALLFGYVIVGDRMYQIAYSYDGENWEANRESALQLLKSFVPAQPVNS